MQWPTSKQRGASILTRGYTGPLSLKSMRARSLSVTSSITLSLTPLVHQTRAPYSYYRRQKSFSTDITFRQTFFVRLWRHRVRFHETGPQYERVDGPGISRGDQSTVGARATVLCGFR